MVLFSARLSATRPQAMPPGLRKSFCRSVITSAVRRGSTVIPGLGRSMAFPLGSRRRKFVGTGFPEKSKSAASSAEPLLPREPPEGSPPGVAEESLRFPRGPAPGRDGPFEQRTPRLCEAIGVDARVVPRYLFQPAVRPHPLQVPAQGRVVELEL